VKTNTKALQATQLKLPRIDRSWLMLAPAIILLCVFFVYPLIGMLLRSVFDPAFTLKHYVQFFGDPAYLHVLLTTFQISILVTLATIGLGYPLAYFLSQQKTKTAGLLMIVVVVPYFTSVLVRTYAWMILLGTGGIVNELLASLGIISQPIKIMYTRTGVVIGMTYILLPYMILALYSVMRGIDTTLMRAAESLGASKFQAFWRAFFPLSLPGLASGGLLVFILAIGFFITPALMGSEQDSTIPMLIDSQVETYFHWGFASTLSTVLLACTLVLFFIYERVVGLKRLFEAKL